MGSRGRAKVATFFAGVLLAAAVAGSASPAFAQSRDDSMTLVVEIPKRSPSPTTSASPSSAPTSQPDPAPGGDQATGQLPPTGGEAVLWLLLAGGSVVVVGLVVRRVARGRQSSTAPRS